MKSNMLLKKALAISLLLCSFIGNSQEVIYSKVNVQIESIEEVQRLISLGLDIDHYEGDVQNGISFYVNPSELEKLTTSNFSFEVTIPDYHAYYKEQQLLDADNISNAIKSSNTANGFDYGSMGGFYTYDEIGAKLDEMRQDFPNLITEKSSIGLTHEGRDIWVAKISDNPDLNEGELAVYFDGIHHAREPLSMATNINYMFWLLENYATNPQVQYLVNNRELYFVPIVNPDGYVYNEQTNPNGGGFWRKNRSVNSGGCIGVDLNRNYEFGFANDGSCASNEACSDIYHGTSAFSEPETAAVRDLISTIQPKTAFSIHCFGGKYLMPYGFNTPTPDFGIYAEWASSFLNENNYTYGTVYDMLSYYACGGTMDYFHSEGVYTWTPELGFSGFWPPQSQIFDLVAENVYPMFYQSWIAGAYIDVQSHSQIGVALPGATFNLLVEVKNVGIGATSLNSEVVVQATVPGISVSPAVAYGDIPSRFRQHNNSEPFVITVDAAFADTAFNLLITTFQDGVENETSEITINIGEKDVLFFDDSEAGNINWTASGVGVDWGAVNDDSYSGVLCLGDSAGRNYANFTQNYFELNEVFDLTTTTFPGITFMAKYSLGGGDLLRFQASTDSGISWETLKTYTLSELWKQQLVDLSDYAAYNDVRFRFYLNNVNDSSADGFYFDDFEVADYASNILDVISSENFSEVIITPNPFRDTFTIEGITSGNTTAEIYDMNGRRIVLDFQKNESSIIFKKLDGLTPGVYFLKIHNESGSQIVKKMLKI